MFYYYFVLFVSVCFLERELVCSCRTVIKIEMVMGLFLIHLTCQEIKSVVHAPTAKPNDSVKFQPFFDKQVP